MGVFQIYSALKRLACSCSDYCVKGQKVATPKMVSVNCPGHTGPLPSQLACSWASPPLRVPMLEAIL